MSIEPENSVTRKKSRKLKSIRPAPTATTSPQVERAYLILKYAHDSAKASLRAFDIVRSRGAKGGTTTDEEQDLLRAMLVFAAAGLDSMLKQVIRDSLPDLALVDEKAHEELETFTARRLRFDSPESVDQGASKFLARLLAARSTQEQLLQEYVNALVRGSLQSPDELTKAVKALGVDAQGVGVNQKQLGPIFHIRNQIIHDLDINFDHPKRNRQTRAREPMRQHADRLLEVAENILGAVDRKCGALGTVPNAKTYTH